MFDSELYQLYYKINDYLFLIKETAEKQVSRSQDFKLIRKRDPVSNLHHLILRNYLMCARCKFLSETAIGDTVALVLSR